VLSERKNAVRMPFENRDKAELPKFRQDAVGAE
jgi:hypothetical protein